MSMRSFEALILKELRLVAKDPKIRQKDIMEWSTGDVKVMEGEVHYFLPDCSVNVSVLIR